MNDKEVIKIEVVISDIVIPKKIQVTRRSGKMVLIKVFNCYKWIEYNKSETIYLKL